MTKTTLLNSLRILEGVPDQARRAVPAVVSLALCIGPLSALASKALAQGVADVSESKAGFVVEGEEAGVGFLASGVRPRFGTQTRATGAALVAGLGIGAFASPQDAVTRCARLRAEARPDPGRRKTYARLFSLYDEARLRLTDISHTLGEGFAGER